jgi:hypothetical protein
MFSYYTLILGFYLPVFATLQRQIKNILHQYSGM